VSKIGLKSLLFDSFCGARCLSQGETDDVFYLLFESRVNHGTSDPTSFSERTAPELARFGLAYYLVPNPTNPYNLKPFVNEPASKTVYQTIDHSA
jgi:hypothetical protein